MWADAVHPEPMPRGERRPGELRVGPVGTPQAPAHAGAAHARGPLLLTFGSILRPDGGLQVRTRVLAESLSELGAPPAVVSTREVGSALRTPAWARSFAVPRHSSRLRFLVDLVRLTRQAAAESSFVVISDATMLPVLAAAGVRLPLVWDANECQSLHYGRLARTPDNLARRLAWLALERWAGHRCSVAVAIGDSEAAHWKRIHPQFSRKLVTVDHAPFATASVGADGRARLEQRLGRPLEGPVLVFVGTMEAKHNGPAAQWIIDVLGPSLPTTTTIALCGPGTEKLRGRAAGARVECLGMVDDLDSVIAISDLCLAPLISGAGVKTKVLHYLAHGRRVAGTPLAFEGLDGAPGLFEAPLDSLPALIARLTEKGEPQETALGRAVTQRAWMERHHGRQHVASQWKEILECLSPV